MFYNANQNFSEQELVPKLTDKTVEELWLLYKEFPLGAKHKHPSEPAYSLSVDLTTFKTVVAGWKM